jgi:hypothetical protein
LEELGHDVYLTDSSQDIWKLKSDNFSIRDAYIDKMRAQVLSVEISLDKKYLECDKEEYTDV